MKRSTWIYSAGGAALAVLALAWAFAPRPLEVEAAAVVAAPFEATIDEDGRTRLRDRYVVSAPLAGRLGRIALREGDTVAAGDVVATLMPMLSPRGLSKIVELSGADLPLDVARRLEPYADDVAGFRATGIDIATEMCQRLLDEGVPALHFYTMNRSKATKEVLGRLGLVARA